MHVCFCCICFSFLVLIQEIGWKERLRDDLLCVGWDLEDYHPSVLLHCWLGHLTCKIISAMTYNVSSGTLNPTIPIRETITQFTEWWTVLFLHVSSVWVLNHWLRKGKKHDEDARNVKFGCIFTSIFFGDTTLQQRQSWTQLHGYKPSQSNDIRTVSILFVTVCDAWEKFKSESGLHSVKL